MMTMPSIQLRLLQNNQTWKSSLITLTDLLVSSEHPEDRSPDLPLSLFLPCLKVLFGLLPQLMPEANRVRSKWGGSYQGF